MNENIIQIVVAWFLGSGLKIAGILVGGYLTHKFAKIFIEKSVRKIVVADRYLSKEAEVKRENTLIRIFHGTMHVVLIIMVALMVLSELGVNIGPLIATAGVAGLAFGFGAQYLIKDLITGLFMILENQYRVGDVACFDGTCGLVEDITLRKTMLRDLDGVVHHVPHGTITKVSNLSKDFARVNLNIGVAYNTDPQKLEEVINRVGQELANDAEWKENIIKAPKFERVDKFGDSSVVVKILGETKPIMQWAVTGELRKRLWVEFAKEGIEIPFPQVVITKAV